MLTLTPFERYVLVDDRADHPMTYSIEVALSQRCDHDRLRSALAAAIAYHPMLTSRMTSSGWTFGHPALEMKWFDETATRPSVGVTIDLRNESPLRTNVFVSERQTTLQLIVHHAASDGIGLFQFLADWINCYHGIEKRRPAVDPEAALARRAEIRFQPPAVVSRWQATRFLFRETVRFLFARPVCLGVRQSSDAQQNPVDLISRELDEATTRAMIQLAVEQEVTLNTLLLAVAFCVLARFEPQRPRGNVIRMTVPVNLRQREDLRLPATNKIGYAFIDRACDQCTNPLDLIESLQTEMDAVLEWSLAAMFLAAVAAIDRFPGGLWLATTAFSGSSTAVFSNIGDLGRRFRLSNQPDGGVIAVRGAPPVRAGTAVSFGVIAMNGTTAISLARDPLKISPSQGQQLIDDYLHTCQQLLQVPNVQGSDSPQVDGVDV